MLPLLLFCVATAPSAPPSPSENAPAVASFAPTNLTVTGLEQGFLGHGTPEFRWALSCDGCVAVRQTAYRVTLQPATDDADGHTLLDTGRVVTVALRHTTASVVSPSTPLPLESDTAYRWQLEIWGTVGPHAVTSVASGSFRTALLRSDEWHGAEWIGGGTALRSEFPLAGGIHSATAYVSGAGCFELSVNGAKVAPQVFLERARRDDIPNSHFRATIHSDTMTSLRFAASWASVPMVRMLYRA